MLVKFDKNKIYNLKEKKINYTQLINKRKQWKIYSR